MKQIGIGLLASVVLCSASYVAGQDEKKKPAADRQAAPAEIKVKTYQDLENAFKAMKVNFKGNEPGSTLMFQTKRQGFEGVMVVKWDEKNGVMHLIQTMPLTIEKDKYDLYLRVAQKLNHGFLFPGIGFNLTNGGTYYRLSIPISPRNYIRRFELETYTRFTINKAAEFLPTIKKAMDGDVEIDEIIPFHQKRLREIAAQKAKSIRLAGRFTRKALDSEWELDFSKPGEVTLKRDGEKNVVSKVTMKGNEYTLEDKDGVLKVAGPGTYQVFLTNDKLTFRLKKDSAEPRAKLLTEGEWTLVK